MRFLLTLITTGIISQLCCSRVYAELYAGASLTYKKIKGDRKEMIGFTGAGYVPLENPPTSISMRKIIPGVLVGYCKRCPLWISGFEAGYDTYNIVMNVSTTNAYNDVNVVYNGSYTKRENFYLRAKYGSMIESDVAFYGFVGGRLSNFNYSYKYVSTAINPPDHPPSITYTLNRTFKLRGIEFGGGLEKIWDRMRACAEIGIVRYQQSKQENIEQTFSSEHIATPQVLMAGIRIAYAFQ